MFMSKLRVWSLVLPLSVGGAFALLAACSDDENPGTVTTNDASPDQQAADGGTDAAVDAPVDAPAQDTSLPPLCTTYPNTLVDSGIGVDGGERRYLVIARQALDLAHARCELKHVFDLTDYDLDDVLYYGDLNSEYVPEGIECLEKQLEALSGCRIAGGAPVVYETATETANNARCVPDAGPSIQLGFRLNEPGYGRTYVKRDAELLIQLIRIRAVAFGFTSADANRLVALLRAQIDKVATVDAGADGGYSNSTCP